MTKRDTLQGIEDYQEELLQRMEKELEEFRRQKEQELAETIRDRMTLETELEELGRALGIVDREILTVLKELGYTAETLPALHLVPLIEITWAEGQVTLAEQELVLKIARSNGMDESGYAYLNLLDWLYVRPSQDFFDKSLQALRASLPNMPSEKRELIKQNLASYCAQVREMSEEFISRLGFGSKITEKKQQVIDRITSELEFDPVSE